MSTGGGGWARGGRATCTQRPAGEKGRNREGSYGADRGISRLREQLGHVARGPARCGQVLQEHDELLEVHLLQLLRPAGEYALALADAALLLRVNRDGGIFFVVVR